MPQFSESIEIARPPEDVWRVIGRPERWFEGYLETRTRSADYPGPDTRDDHLYRTRRREEVDARVTRSEAPSVLEEDQEGKTFSRHVRYSRRPHGPRAGYRSEDERAQPCPTSSLLAMIDPIGFERRRKNLKLSAFRLSRPDSVHVDPPSPAGRGGMVLIGREERPEDTVAAHAQAPRVGRALLARVCRGDLPDGAPLLGRDSTLNLQRNPVVLRTDPP